MQNTRFIRLALSLSAISLVAACSSSPLFQPAPLTVPKQSPLSLQKYLIQPNALPKPGETESASNGPEVVARPDDAKLLLPEGFEISVFAEGDLNRPRWAALAPNGDVFVAESNINRVSVLRDADGDGKAEEKFTWSTFLQQPFGMAFHENFLYVANTDSVVRFPYKPGQTEAEGPAEKICDLPGKGYNQHWTRNVIFAPDGKKMYVTVGSETNVSVEPEPMRAAVTEFNPDGTGKRIFAGGLRNPTGMAFQPGTGKLWTTVNERDGLGDDLVPDYVTEVKDGAFYGWPYAYIGPNEDPRLAGENPDLVRKSVVPDVLVQAHSAALGIVFYDGANFPADYRGDAFVALHGSWNRAKRTGYKVIRIRFKDGKPVGGYEDFVVGWMLDETKSQVWGRPAGLLVLKDGSLLVCDDGGNKIWRVAHRGGEKTQTP